MIGKNTPNVLISPEEAAALARKAGTADDIMRGLSVYDAYIRFADIEEYAAKDFLIYSALGAIFSAGRIQGIREERQLRKQTIGNDTNPA